jgi:hypothetical protein
MAISKVPSTGINGSAFTVSEAAPSNSLTLGSGGFIGLGTASPAFALDVRASSQALINATSPTSWVSTDSGLSTQSMYMQVNTSSSDCRIGSYTSHNLSLMTNNTARMVIGSTGNISASNAILTIGDNTRTASTSTTTGAIVCGGGLGIWNNITAGGGATFGDQVQIFNNPTSSAQGILFRNTYNTGASIFSTGAATTNGFINWVGGNGTQGSIYGNGAGITYGSASDYRLKENITPMVSALDKVALLRPVTFNWKFDGSNADGFIAHELAEVYPYAVNGKKDAVDEEGNPEYQNIDTSFIVAALTAAIQELKAIVDAQAIEIAALKAK